LEPAEFVAQDVEAVEVLELLELVVEELVLDFEETATFPFAMLLADEPEEGARAARKPAT
jgi:hypothetical protein